MLRYLTAGESHGKALVAILEGMPANVPLLAEEIDHELARRQEGYGRGGRMAIEKDRAEILSGVRFGKTLGSPIALLIPNKDWANWQKKMSAAPDDEQEAEKITTLRPGHADFAGMTKYDQDDIRNILERSSARETAARVAVGAITRKLLGLFGIEISSKIVEIGGKPVEGHENIIDAAKAAGDTVGGIFEVRAVNVPVGLGSHVHYDRKLDAALCGAIMSIQAIKGVEVGLGFGAAKLPGSQVHDAFYVDKDNEVIRKTGNAGGIEGGMSNGQPIVLRAAMKPIPTLMNPLPSVDMKNKKEAKAHVERADVCALEAAAVVGEAVVAFELAKFFLDKFGGDSLAEIRAHFSSRPVS
ncbi:MAG: chorismate synthase [Candidatus Margulisiibacteriota bacterium]|jgi:chorismate synthase